MSIKWVENDNSKCSALFKALREKVVPCLREKDAIDIVTFMQDGATDHTTNPVKEFLIQTFGKERIISKRCKFS